MARRRRRQRQRQRQQQRWEPELNEDVTAEILLRIPPDEPAHLFRASVVCKLWLRVASDPAFLRRYRDFHRGAPLLGFFYNPDSSGPFPGFLYNPDSAASWRPQPRHGKGCARCVYDCRHGRVLLGEISRSKLVVWDPFSNHCEELQAPSSLCPFQSNAVVLCAEPGCNHHSCRGGRFRVVCLSINDPDCTTLHAHVYSSESRSWSTPAPAQLAGIHYFDMKRAALIGDGIYCTIDHGHRILKYDLVEHRLSLIGMPSLYGNDPVLMQNEDGSLGIACVLGSRLHLWSTMVNAEGVAGWVEKRVILPEGVISFEANVIGFAEGVEVFFISTVVGAFTFELKSGRVRKVSEHTGYCGITPFISFFTPDRGCSKWTK
ncbi:hypothetical protein BDA96_02G019600 [Sorghum bicolor]|uniref:F-box domain-containing protein n=1 Tax=Sorghum bicolor TaxID=4558 RepID=A0A921RKS5_SORBI|nr:hypothetical protein BDA96_02G019600 [Sorghum bicolor]